MTDSIQISPRQKKVDRYLRAANIGTVAAIAAPFIYFAIDHVFTGWEEDDALLIPALTLLAILVFLVFEAYAVLAVFARRKTDEFTLAMWHSGTSYAFFAAIIWFIIGPWAELVFDLWFALDPDQLAQASTTDDSDQLTDTSLMEATIIERYATPVIFGAFFLGFQIKRFRGDI